MSTKGKLILAGVVAVFVLAVVVKCGYTPDPKQQEQKTRSAN